MDDKMSVGGGGGVVVLICMLGKFSENLVSEEEVWCEIVSWENLVILDHPVTILVPLPPQVCRAIALLLCCPSTRPPPTPSRSGGQTRATGRRVVRPAAARRDGGAACQIYGQMSVEEAATAGIIV